MSLAGRALGDGAWSLETVEIRDFTADKHRTVDDTPEGGISMLSSLYRAADLAGGQLVQPSDILYLPSSAHWLVHPANRAGVRKIERFREWIHEELAADRDLVPPEVWEPPQ